MVLESSEARQAWPAFRSPRRVAWEDEDASHCWAEAANDEAAVAERHSAEEERVGLKALDSGVPPGIKERKKQRRCPAFLTELVTSPRAPICSEESPQKRMRRPGGLMTLKTPSSCASPYRMLSPCTPEPQRDELKCVSEDVKVILFDFDGTLTATPGDVAQRCRKQVELRERAVLLAPRLKAMRNAGFTLGIISKSTKPTICGALQEAGLMELFDGPLLGKATGFEGKAGLIEELFHAGEFCRFGADGLRRVLLIDDDIHELDRAQERGIQTYAAPKEGGLQEEHFDEIFSSLGLPSPSVGLAWAQSPGGVGLAWALSPSSARSSVAAPILPPRMPSSRRQRPRGLSLKTPSSCASPSFRPVLTPCTPEMQRDDLKCVTEDVKAILFDFDGTLTASPGDVAQRCRKQVELRERAPLLAPRLKALRNAGITLGIISKSTSLTICGALQEAGLMELFDGPLLAKATGFEGKAGLIEDLVCAGEFCHFGADGLRRVLLIDDDMRELDRARERGIQTYAAPKEGGLQEEHFDEIFSSLGLATDAGWLLSPGAGRTWDKSASSMSVCGTVTAFNTFVAPERLL